MSFRHINLVTRKLHVDEMKRVFLLLLELTLVQTLKELKSTTVTCGTKAITIEPALLHVVEPIQYYRVGDCIFDSKSTSVTIVSHDDKWLFECGVSVLNAIGSTYSFT